MWRVIDCKFGVLKVLLQSDHDRNLRTRLSPRFLLIAVAEIATFAGRAFEDDC